MTGYRKLIQDSAGCPDRDVVAVEELMRVEYGTLDHLDRRAFARAARKAAAVLSQLDRDDPDAAAFYRG